ncbi:MAG: hypothetical protein IH629_01725, partial [Thermoleophilia bacterium]|nr:hypothetical protein [Thermoleophilia bacterium]
MTTVQIIGIAVASLAVLLLVIALIVTRRRHDEPEASDARPDHGSFLDGAPQDTLAGLGKTEQPLEDVTLDPAVERALAAEVVSTEGERLPQPRALGLDWRPDLDKSSTGRHEEPPAEDRVAPASPADDESEISGELAAAQVAGAPAASSPPAPEGESGHG